MTKWRATMSLSDIELNDTQNAVDNSSYWNITHDTGELINSLYTRYMPTMRKLLPNISDVAEMINEKTTNHFGDMEFALDEHGKPDGLKNEQEIVLTIASEVSEEVAEEVFNNIKDFLLKNDHINELAMELLEVELLEESEEE